MIFEVHWSLGDHVCYTGIPQAYHKYFGFKLGLLSDNSNYDPVWANNPYICKPNPSDVSRYKVQIETLPSDWRYYRPQRIFYEMTNLWVPAQEVQPRIYRERKTVPGRILLCNEAGWPSRQGYQYWNDLVKTLNNKYDTFAINNKNYSTDEPIQAKNNLRLSLENTIEFLTTTELYIGYDSGLAHLAGGLGIPYVLICGSVPSYIVRHLSCICAIETCENPCCVKVCQQHCLAASKNRNAEILERINAYEFNKINTSR